jgi:hypothetical protein
MPAKLFWECGAHTSGSLAVKGWLWVKQDKVHQPLPYSSLHFPHATQRKVFIATRYFTKYLRSIWAWQNNYLLRDWILLRRCINILSSQSTLHGDTVQPQAL